MTGTSAQTDGRLVGGRYRLRTSLGQGGMGTVWAGRDELLDRDVAIKEVTLPSGLDQRQRDQLRERTLREARAAARLRSAAAVTVYDVVEEDDRPWIVMELLPSRSLADVLREDGPLTPAAAAAVGLRLLDALADAHEAGVLHRDVKPANVLTDATGQAVLTDFGIASLEGDSSMTTTGTVIGSPGYVAPERAMGRPPSPASDLWSLGVTLATAVQGRSPFERDTPMATMVAAIQEPLPPTMADGPLGPVLEGLLRKDPAERIDAAEARRLLQDPATLLPVAADEATATTRVDAAAWHEPFDGHDVGGSASGADPERTQALPRPAVAAGAAGGAAGAAAAAASRPGPARPPVGPPAPVRPAVDRPGPAQGAPAPRRSKLLPLAVLVTVLVLVGAVTALVLGARDEAGTVAGGAATTGPTTSAPESAPAEEQPAEEQPAEDEAPAEPSQEAEPDPAPETAEASPAEEPAEPGPGQAPEGFQLHEDPGYAVAVPAGWTVEPDGDTRTRFVDPASRRYLLVEEGGEPAGDPVEDWQRQEQSVSQRLDGYQLIGIDRADYRDFDAADWQFTWEPGGGTVRVLNRAVVDTDLNRAYALYWSIPVEEWDASQDLVQQVAASFEPRG